LGVAPEEPHGMALMPKIGRKERHFSSFGRQANRSRPRRAPSQGMFAACGAISDLVRARQITVSGWVLNGKPPLRCHDGPG
jgi:hypothetical protein